MSRTARVSSPRCKPPLPGSTKGQPTEIQYRDWLGGPSQEGTPLLRIRAPDILFGCSRLTRLNCHADPAKPGPIEAATACQFSLVSLLQPDDIPGCVYKEVTVTKRPTPRWLRSLSLVAVCVGFVLAGPAVAAEQAKDRPNVVVILADDLGYGDLGCYGCPDIKTPALDRLAEQGVRFTSFYANAPECTPTRAALLTGRYPQRVGGLECAIGLGGVGRYDDAVRLQKQQDLGLPVEETSLARLLKDADYATALCGKWHLGYEAKFSPRRHGFDHAFGIVGGGADYFHHREPDGDHVLFLNDKPVKLEGYLTDLITEEAVQFIKSSKGKPFFLYVPYTAPHTPYQGPDDKKAEPVSLKEMNKGSRVIYRAMVERLDQGVGTILQALDDQKLAEQTLVIFTSDNGGTQQGRNAPFSGAKSTTFEGGIHVPCLARWPGVLPPKTTSDQVAITMDLTASIVRLAGAAPPKDRPFDGLDVLRLVEAKKQPVPRTLFWRYRRDVRTWKAVRDGSFKYVLQRNGDKEQEYLFDLERDPGEKESLLDQRKDDLARLKDLLAKWERDVKASR